MINKTILNSSLQPRIDKHLRENPNGFLPSRSTTTHAFALRRLIEEVKTGNKEAVIVYADFKEAFDSISRKMVLKILRANRAPATIVKAITVIYEAKVITPDGMI